MAAPMKVEIQEISQSKGRGFIAIHPICEGEILFEEEPIVCCQFLWNAFYKYAACDHCMKALETAEENARRLCNNHTLVLPHPECCSVNKQLYSVCPHCQVQYCSEVCRDTAWGMYHESLCTRQSSKDPDHPLEKLQEIWRNLHFPPETANIMLVARLIATVKQAKNKDLILQKLSKFCRTTKNEEKEIAHKLLGAEFQAQLDVLRTHTTEALHEETVETWFTPEGFNSLFALIGTNGQGVGTSSLSTWVNNCDDLDLPSTDRETLDAFIDKLYEDIEKESGNFTNCEGSALYALQSTANHSCEPNAEVVFPHDNFIVGLKATCDIQPGEEVCICYLDCCQRGRSRHSRQKILRENYLFRCDCSKCLLEAGDPEETSSEESEDDMEES
ncbi:unnamed protein product [Owenia fusiformis]|uniref:Protein-lysine N-trimethyltransferase SMYD5 n=1 Tax=Owenia fusiformis TaxID=6347 RepID=A0A8J1T5Z1_OWEFU|nr:unnamed protein product [Owenia fusiformis]